MISGPGRGEEFYRLGEEEKEELQKERGRNGGKVWSFASSKRSLKRGKRVLKKEGKGELRRD